MSFHEVLIPIVASLVPIVTLFTIRGLDKGSKDLGNIKSDIDALRKDVLTNTRSLDVLQERVKNHINGHKAT